MKWPLWITGLLCGLLMIAGCAGQPPDAAQSDHTTYQEIDAWPDNAYTRAVPRPQAGTPHYVLADADAGYYAIFFQNITREQGEQYIDSLLENGYEKVADTRNAAAIGELLRKDPVQLSVSISDNELGVYITLQSEAGSSEPQTAPDD